MSEALINELTGAGGGIISQRLTYPLQTVNTRQQTDRDRSKARRRDGDIHQMYQVVKNEGWDNCVGPSLVGTTASQIFLSGAVAKLGATVVTYPASCGEGTWDAITKMIRFEGFFGFYKGMNTKIVQSVLAAAVLFMVKEELIRVAHLLLIRDLSLMNGSKSRLT